MDKKESFINALATINAEEDGIFTANGVAMLCAQCDHESAGFTRLVENLNYSAEGLLKTFPKYFNKDNVGHYARQPEKIANRVYSNRMGNGDEHSGDGWKYRGRGVIQLTGKNNYIHYGKELDYPLVEDPDKLLEFDFSVRCAVKFFQVNKILNDSDCILVTKKINGGLNGIDDRLKLFAYYKNLVGKDFKEKFK